ncbi:MAG: fumarate hydratase [bacterium]
MSRVITAAKIREEVAELCVSANLILRKDIFSALKRAYIKEPNRRARRILCAIINNAQLAREESLAICQDTGLVSVFVQLGEGLRIAGGLKEAINKGLESGYRRGYLRSSVIKDPLLRGIPSYQPAVIHIDIVKGSSMVITVMPKGFGCENKTQLKMFNPTSTIEEIKSFVVAAVKEAGPDACPPYIIGVGLGGTADYSLLLAKKALIRDINKPNTKQHIATLEKELLKEINRLNIGPMGLGGKTTALAVNIQSYPTHIAGLPVAVNISCHALRSATAKL